jgi:hypothetical protein
MLYLKRVLIAERVVLPVMLDDKMLFNNPHVVDWFFTQRLENFVKHWLLKHLVRNGTGFVMNTKVEVVSIVMALLN